MDVSHVHMWSGHMVKACVIRCHLYTLRAGTW